MFLNDLQNRLHIHAIPTIFQETSSMSSSFQAEAFSFSADIRSFPREEKEVLLENVEDSKENEPPTKIRILSDIRLDTNVEGTLILPAARTCEVTPQQSFEVNLPSTSSTSTLTSAIAVQTPKTFTARSPRKTKLRKALREARRKKLILANTPTSGMDSLEEFLQLTNKYLTPELAAIVQFNAKNKDMAIARYTSEYKQFALNIYFLGPKVYRYLSKIFKLPSVRTLRRFTEKMSISDGICSFIFSAVNLKTLQFNDESRACILCIDQMSLKVNLFYNVSRDEIVGFHKTNIATEYKPAKFAMVLFAKGIHSNWKQPMGYICAHSGCTGKDLEDILSDTIRPGFSITG